MVRTTQANNRGHTLHVWEQGGEVWACAAYDHGPMCRLCQKVEPDVQLALLEPVFSGQLEVWTEPDGSFTFTAPGESVAEARAARDRAVAAKQESKADEGELT